MQIQEKTKAVSAEYLERIIEELKTEISEQNQATQRAIAVIRGEVTNLYSLWQAHRCWINNE